MHSRCSCGSTWIALLSLAFLLGTASTSHADAAEDCRALLFLDPGPTCGPENPCPQPDIVGADEACRICLEDDPDNTECRVLRAATRLLRLAEESDVDGPDAGAYTDSLKEMMDRFGLSSKGKQRQYGLTADGRSLYDFTAEFPKAGSIDRSISRRDSILNVFLEPGSYTLLVAPCCDDYRKLLEEQASDGELWELVEVTPGEWNEVPSTVGDYRLTFSGVVEDVENGTLMEITDGPNAGRVSIAEYPFDVDVSGRLRVDLLSWEKKRDGSGADRNGNERFTYFDSQMYLLRQAATSSGWEVVDDNDDSNSFQWPATAPTGGDVQEFLDRLDAFGEIGTSVADLQDLNDSNFQSLTLNEAELDAIGLDDDNVLVLDLGDLRVVEALLHLLQAKLAVLQDQDLDTLLELFSPFAQQPAIQAELIDGLPSFLTLLSPGPAASETEDARAALHGFVDAYLEGSERIRFDDGSRDDNLLDIPSAALSDERDLRFEMLALKRALDMESAILCNRSRYQDDVIDALVDKLGVPFDERGATLNLAVFLDSPFPLRDVTPRFAYEDGKNSLPDAEGPGDSAFPDPSFNGVLAFPRSDRDCDGDGVPDDGDASGTAGDAVCMGGITVGCDDNAPLTPNGPAYGTCVGGPWAGEMCMNANDCGQDADCSQAQELGESGLPAVICAAGLDEETLYIDDDGLFGVAGFFDELEPGVGISIGDSGIEGEGVEFSCGRCSEATFEDAVPAVNSVIPLCGYTEFGVAQAIAINDDPLCARSTQSDRRWDIDLRSFGGFSCVDADAGESCAVADQRISYARACPEPEAALLLIAALASLGWLRSQRCRPGHARA